MVNVKPTAKRVGGIWGACRITPEKAELAWKMADEPANEFATWMDSGAHQHTFVRDGRVLIRTEGSKETADRALLLDEKDGRVLAASAGVDGVKLAGFILWLGDTALVRRDHSHGASHGGRKPILRWITKPGQLEPERDGNRIGGLDLVGFDTAYEVFMWVPLVDGRMFERLDDGRLACYDLRAPKESAEWSGAFDGLYVGMPPTEFKLWTSGNQVTGAKVWIPTSAEAGLPVGKVRTQAFWERCGVDGLKSDGKSIRGTLQVNYGTHLWPAEIELRRDGSRFAGNWTRNLPAKKPPMPTTLGNLSGRVDEKRIYPTPWLKESPWSPHGRNPPGTRTFVLACEGAIGFREPAKGLTLTLDHDGQRWTRAGAGAFAFSQSWHEIDPSALKLEGDRLTGTAKAVINIDPYLIEQDGTGGAGALTIDATLAPDGTIAGTFKASWGSPANYQGTAEGTVTE